jgi:hypothetical protein
VSAKLADRPGYGPRGRCVHNASLSRIFYFAAAVLFIGCGVARADDLADIRAVRSLAAEAAQVIRMEAQGGVIHIYAREMKASAREELISEADSTSAARVKTLARGAISAADKNNATALEDIVRQLFTMEGPHERAD